MTHTVQEVCDRISRILTSLEGVQTVTLHLRAEHPDQPYFAIAYDAYCAGRIPSRASRRAAFEFSGAFESARGREKDRMFVDELPIRIEYRSVELLESLVSSAESGYAEDPEESYALFRLESGEIVGGTDNTRIETLRSRSAALPAAYWQSLQAALRYKLEHVLSDLMAAAAEGDDVFAFSAQAGFVEYVIRLVFADNRLHYPGLRHGMARSLELENLPDHFESIMTYLVDMEGERTLARRAEYAATLARQLING